MNVGHSEYPFTLVDVFSTAPVSGNPLAVVHDADRLSEPVMQKIACFMNLSETVFLCRPTVPEAHYSIRIFALDRELPWAGHPTLGAAHAWLERRSIEATEIVQQSLSGLTQLRQRPGGLAFTAPPLRRFEPLSRTELQQALVLIGSDGAGLIEAMRVDNGPGWIGLLFDRAETILNLTPQPLWPAHLHIGTIGLHADGETIEARAFHTDQFRRVVEDPVTGSFAAAAARWLIESGRLPPAYGINQGQKIARAGRIEVETTKGEIWIGGQSRSVVRGTFLL